MHKRWCRYTFTIHVQVIPSLARDHNLLSDGGFLSGNLTVTVHTKTRTMLNCSQKNNKFAGNKNHELCQHETVSAPVTDNL